VRSSQKVKSRGGRGKASGSEFGGRYAADKTALESKKTREGKKDETPYAFEGSTTFGDAGVNTRTPSGHQGGGGFEGRGINDEESSKGRRFHLSPCSSMSSVSLVNDTVFDKRDKPQVVEPVSGWTRTITEQHAKIDGSV